MMKIFSLLTVLIASASAFAPSSPAFARQASALNVDLANGAMTFDHVCREWRCKYSGDKSTSESLEKISALVDEYLPELKKVSKDAKVQRLVCGSCLDFKLMTTVPLKDFGDWEEKGYAPETDFLQKLKAIDGVSQVETQTITNEVI